jgi:hypothetical protein
VIDDDSLFAFTYTLTLPSEDAARTVADELAQRGHRLVAVRIVDHFQLDPEHWWYGKPSPRPEFSGWWDVFSVVSGPLTQPDGFEAGESAAIRAMARRHGGIASGPGGGHASTVLSHFTRDGLVHELTDDQVARRRSALGEPVVPGRPRPRPAPPLAFRATPDEQAETAAIAGRMTAVEGEPGDGEPGDEAGDDEWDDEWADSGEMLGVLFREAMDDGTYAEVVPIFVALATDDRVGDRYRAWVLLDLFMIATAGRHDLCVLADTWRALGRPQVEAPEAVTARRAVAGSLGKLLDRWDEESELGRFFLAALAAACPAAGAPLRPEIGRLRQAYAGTDREVTLRLAEALADEDPQQIEEVLRDLGAWDPGAAANYDSPYATAEQRGLCVLQGLITEELGRAD